RSRGSAYSARGCDGQHFGRTGAALVSRRASLRSARLLHCGQRAKAHARSGWFAPSSERRDAARKLCHQSAARGRGRRMILPIDRALLDKNLLAAALGSIKTWSTWLAVLRAAFGLPLSEA